MKRKQTLDAFLGFGGVHPLENETARRWGTHFEGPMLLVALWIIVDWYLTSTNVAPPFEKNVFDWIIWGFFLIETTVLCLLCDNPVRHLKRNWANLTIITLGFPPLFHAEQGFGFLRLVRTLFLVGFFSHNFSTIRNVLSQNNLGKTLIVSVFFITGGGLLVAGVDPAIASAADGIWWAWITVTTVGYGDVVPVSTVGRVLASVLILTGLTLVSLITANVSAYLLAKNRERTVRYEKRELKKLLEMEQRIQNIESKIDQLIDRLPPKEK